MTHPNGNRRSKQDRTWLAEMERSLAWKMRISLSVWIVVMIVAGIAAWPMLKGWLVR